MMLRLRSNVGNGIGLLRNANRERPISLLPREIPRMLLIHPMRRRAFDQLHDFRQRNGRGQRQQNMNVILRAARNESLEFVLAGNSAEEGPKIRLNLSRNQIPAVLCGEYAMDETTNVGVGHGESVDQSADREEK